MNHGEKFVSKERQRLREAGVVQITRISMAKFLNMIDNAGKTKTRVIYLSPRDDVRLRAMETVTGIDLSQFVKDIIREYYDEGHDTTQT